MINQFIAQGNIGRKIDHEVSTEGKTTVKFSLCIQQHGKYKNNPIWIQCYADHRNGEFIYNNCKPGEDITVNGSIMYTKTQNGTYNWVYVKDVSVHWKGQKPLQEEDIQEPTAESVF